MNARPVLLLLLVVLPVQAASAIQPIRILGAGFEPGDPARDCAADARTEVELAAALRAPAGEGFCIPPFTVQGVTVCAGPLARCAAAGCFVPLGPSTTVEVDAPAGLVGFLDPLGAGEGRIESQFQPACNASFSVGTANLALRYALANDGLDGLALGGLALPPTVTLAGAIQVSGCPAYNSVLPQIVQQLRLRVEQGYVDATLARIGEPLDAVVCPVVRP